MQTEIKYTQIQQTYLSTAAVAFKWEDLSKKKNLVIAMPIK